MRGLLMLVVLATPCGAAAQDDAARARSLFDEGVALSDRGHLDAAVELFRQSLELVERPSTLYNLGVALRELHRDVEALEALERFLAIADASIDAERRAQVQRWIDAMGPQDGTFVLELDPPSASVLVDDADSATGASPLEITLVPGTHHVEVRADGRLPQIFDLEIAPGERIERSIELAQGASGAPQDVGMIVGGWLAIGAAGAVLVGALVATGFREDQVSRYDGAACAPSTWGLRRDACPQLRADIDVTTGLTATAWITTGLLAGAGIALLALAPSSGPHAASALECGPGPGQIGVACASRF